MLTPLTTERAIADRFGAVFCSVVSLVCTCTLLVVFDWGTDEKLGEMAALLFGSPLFVGAVGAAIGSALLCARLSAVVYSRKAAVPLAVLAAVPGVGLVIALSLSRKVTESLRLRDLHIERCRGCRFVEMTPPVGVCLSCLRSIS